MNPNPESTDQAATPESAAQAPQISVMPTLSREQVLTAELETAKTTIAAHEKRIGSLVEESAKHKAFADRYQSELKAIQTNQLISTLKKIEMLEMSALEEAGDKLGALAAAVAEQQAGGSLTIKVGMKPYKGNTALEFAVDIKAAPPKIPGTGLFWSGENNTIVRSDPNQRRLKFGDKHDEDEETD